MMTDEDLAKVKSGELVVAIFPSHRTREKYCPPDAKELYTFSTRNASHIWLITRKQMHSILAQTHLVRFPKNKKVELYHYCWSSRDDGKK